MIRRIVQINDILEKKTPNEIFILYFIITFKTSYFPEI